MQTATLHGLSLAGRGKALRRLRAKGNLSRAEVLNDIKELSRELAPHNIRQDELRELGQRWAAKLSRQRTENELRGIVLGEKRRLARTIGTYADGSIKFAELGHNFLADEGEQDMLNVYFRGGTAPAQFYFRLFNDTPVETDTLALLTGEPLHDFSVTVAAGDTFLEGDQINGQTSTATGTIVKIVSGGGVAGVNQWLVTKDNANDFQAAETVEKVGAVTNTASLDTITTNASGYQAQLVERNTTGFPTLALAAGDFQVESKEVTFQNTQTAGGSSWGPVTYLVVSTTLDNTGKVVAAIALSKSRTVDPGETLRSSYDLKQQ